MNPVQESKWKTVLVKVEKQITREQFETWFTGLKVSSFTEKHIHVIVPNAFVKECLFNNYTTLISDTVRNIYNITPKIQFLCDNKYISKDLKTKKSISSNPPKFARITNRKEHTSSINKNYVFDNFVVGQCNRLAYAAALAIIESPGYIYNPLFIYGPNGVGKTHLLQSIHTRFSSENHRGKSLYITSDDMVHHLTSTRQGESLGQFRNIYEDIDMLLIDDIHLLSASDRTGEEFFHTFNKLYNLQKQIVLSSDRQPEEISTIDERLISRFNWGLKCKLEFPDIETRMSIIEKKTGLFSINLPIDVKKFIAENVTSNVREIEGSILKIKEGMMINNNQATLDVAKIALHDLVKGEKNVSIEKILKVTAHQFALPTSKLLSKNISRSITLPRQIAMYLARKLTTLSFKEIGGYIGGRDHTTVIHAYKKIQRSRKESKDLASLIQEIENKIQRC